MLDKFAFQMLNGNGDLLDLVKVVAPELRPHWYQMSHDEILTEVRIKFVN